MAITFDIQKIRPNVLRVYARLTAQTTSSTEAITGLPIAGTIIRRTISLVSGTGTTTIDPVLHRSATKPAATNAEDLIEQVLETGSSYDGSATTPAANALSTAEVAYYAPAGTWYLTPQADAGTDVVVVAEYLVRVD